MHRADKAMNRIVASKGIATQGGGRALMSKELAGQRTAMISAGREVISIVPVKRSDEVHRIAQERPCVGIEAFCLAPDLL